MATRLMGLLPVLAVTGAFAHGGVPPAGIAGYPDDLVAPPWPNRAPACSDSGANEACGVTRSCLIDEPAQPLLPGENRYRTGEPFEIPWLLAVVHGDSNQITVRIRSSQSGREDFLIRDFPQGENRSQGEVLAIGPLAIPGDFPAGEAVIEVRNQTPMEAYIDCLDVLIQSTAEDVFFDGFEG